MSRGHYALIIEHDFVEEAWLHFRYFHVLFLQDLDDEREVTRDEVMEYCNSVVTPYIETSAKV